MFNYITKKIENNLNKKILNELIKSVDEFIDGCNENKNELNKSIDEFINECNENKNEYDIKKIGVNKFQFDEYRFEWITSYRGYAIEIFKDDKLIVGYADQRRHLPSSFKDVSDIECEDYSKLIELKKAFDKKFLNKNKKNINKYNL